MEQPTDAARDEARQAAQTAGAEASDVRDSAQEQAGRVAREANRQARNVFEDTKAQLRSQANEQTKRLGSVIQDFSGNARALGEGRGEDAGDLGRYASQAADRLEDMAARLNDLGFDGVVEEAKRFARQRPGAFLLGAATAGFAATRLARAARDAEQTAGADTVSSATGRATDPSVVPTAPTQPLSAEDVSESGIAAERGPGTVPLEPERGEGWR